MKIRITAAAAVALLAISASSAFARIAPDSAGTQLTIKHAAALHAAKHKVVKNKATGSKTKVSTGKNTRPDGGRGLRPLIIVAPIQSPGVSIPDDSTSNCVLSMTDCTDAQLCDVWGMNCADVRYDAPSADAQPAPDPSASATSTATDSSSSGASSGASGSGQPADVSPSLAGATVMAVNDGYDEDC